MTDQLQSEQVNELYTALAKAQGEMRPAIKDSANPYYKSKYSDLSSVWDACREPLSKNGLCVSQSIMAKEIGSVLVTILGHRSGQWIKSVAPIITAKPDAQAYGSAVSYQRRYALSALVGVSAEDDDGEKAQDRNQKTQQQVAKPSLQQVNELNAILKDCPATYVENMMKGIGQRGWHSLADMTIDAYTNLRNNALIKRAENLVPTQQEVIEAVEE